MAPRGKLGILCAACCNALLVMSGFAQSQTTGRIAGTVRGALGRVIPAEILAMRAGTGAEHKTLTNSLSYYSLLSLAPGNFEVTISAAAFANSISHLLAVIVGETTTLKTVLQVAQTA